jgi:Neocarzinostatin family
VIPKLGKRWRYCCAAALIVTSAVAVAGTPSAAQSTRTLTVAPDTDLVDGDVVMLHGTGFTPFSTVYFCQGVEDGEPGPEDCGVGYEAAQADAAGDFDATYTVRRFMAPSIVGVATDLA